MKQTAVEWLENEFQEMCKDFGGLNTDFIERFEQAKEMEKEQMNELFNAGVRYGSGSVMSNQWGEDTEEYNFEQYYNETFKSK